MRISGCWPSRFSLPKSLEPKLKIPDISHFYKAVWLRRLRAQCYARRTPTQMTQQHLNSFFYSYKCTSQDIKPKFLGSVRITCVVNAQIWQVLLSRTIIHFCETHFFRFLPKFTTSKFGKPRKFIHTFMLLNPPRMILMA